MAERGALPLWKRPWLGAVVAAVAAAVILLLDDQTGLVPLARLRAAAATVDAEVRDLELRREALLARAERLRRDPFEIEAVARKSLGMVRPGEIVVRFSPAGDRLGPD